MDDIVWCAAFFDAPRTDEGRPDGAYFLYCVRLELNGTRDDATLKPRGSGCACSVLVDFRRLS